MRQQTEDARRTCHLFTSADEPGAAALARASPIKRFRVANEEGRALPLVRHLIPLLCGHLRRNTADMGAFACPDLAALAARTGEGLMRPRLERPRFKRPRLKRPKPPASPRPSP